MEIEFAVSDWAGCAPGLHSRAQWHAWASRPCLPDGPLDPALPELPAMLRRRLGMLGRIAVRAALDCAGPHADHLPMVFASRYGDAPRAVEVLRCQALGEPLSPTDFALSVHNAIGALYSIARQDLSGHSVVSAGQATAAAALAEAAGLLADGADEVLVVHYDAPLPAPYDVFADEPAVPYAWAWRVGAARPGHPRIRLVSTQRPRPTPAAVLPFGLDVMRFIASDLPALQSAADGLHWTWQRHA